MLSRLSVASAVRIVAGSSLGYAAWRSQTQRNAEQVLLSVKTSDGARLVVNEGGGRRALSLGSCVQGVAFVDDGTASLRHVEEWTQLIAAYASGWLLERPHEQPRALFLGLGAAVVPRSLLALHPAISVVCVELYPEVIEAAQRFFGLDLSSGRCTAIVADAARFVEGCCEAYDVIVVDLFTDEGLAPGVSEVRPSRQKRRPLLRPRPLASYQTEDFRSASHLVPCSPTLLSNLLPSLHASSARLPRWQLLGHLPACLRADGLCIINTTWGLDSTGRAETATRLASELAASPPQQQQPSSPTPPPPPPLNAFYFVEAHSCRNVLLLCHRGDALHDETWRALLGRSLPHATEICPDVIQTRACLRPWLRREGSDAR